MEIESVLHLRLAQYNGETSGFDICSPSGPDM